MVEENIDSLAKLLNKVYDMEFKDCVVDYIYKFDIKEQDIITFRQFKNYESADKARIELIK
jgi:L-arabinose isomerase